MFTPILKSTGLFHPSAYPVIRHRDDILPFVAKNKGIRMFTAGPIQILRYMVNGPETFQTDYDLECRSLIFETATGKLLSRTFHKFHNHGGSPETAAALMAAGPVTLFDKLDGSMLGGFALDDTLLFHTKGGISDQAKSARETAPANVMDLVKDALSYGATAMYEWVGPQNRIVLPYDKPDFILLAVRYHTSGEYDEELANHLSEKHGVARPAVLGVAHDEAELQEWLKKLGAMEGKEGAVAVGPDGRRGKMKTRGYLDVHKALSMLSFERHAFRAVVTELDDDLVPLLGAPQAAFFTAYAQAVRAKMLSISELAESAVQEWATLDPRTRAERIKAFQPASLQPLLFTAAKSGSAYDMFKSLLEKRLGNAIGVEEACAEFDLPRWTPPKGLFLTE